MEWKRKKIGTETDREDVIVECGGKIANKEECKEVQWQVGEEIKKEMG